MALLKKKISSKTLQTEHLFAFKNHLGVRSSFRSKSLDEYIHSIDSTSNTIYNVERTLVLLRRALSFLNVMKKENKQILFIGTSLKSRRLTKFIGKSTQNPYVQHRWTKGFLTNWESISTSIKFFNLFLKKLSLSKKGEYNIRQEFEGLSTLKELPSALFFIDLNVDSEIINEAKKLNIPIIAIVDNNYSSVNKIDYPIVSNTSSTLPLFLIISLVVDLLKK